jgi:voltage-gated potassium channel
MAWKELRFALFCLLFLFLFGTIGYYFIEDWNILDSVYMTVISLTTTGYGEVHPLTTKGKIFSIVLLILGASLFVYVITLLARALMEGQFRDLLEKKVMRDKINKLHSHYIICGFGRIGKTISESLKASGSSFVIIEKNKEVFDELKKNGYLYVEGDATQEELLVNAGITRAKVLICVLHSDADNVYTTLTARSLNPGLFIIARSSEKRAERNLFQAGANQVVSPYEIGAKRMALAVLKPNVIEFLDIVTQKGDILSLTLEQIQITDQSFLKEKSMKELDFRNKFGVSVLAVQKSLGDMILSPKPDYIFESGDIIIAMGSFNELEKLSQVS